MLKKVTFSAEERLIHEAREKAGQEGKSLNELFREWIARYIGGGRDAQEYERLMRRLMYGAAGRRLPRNEANVR